MFGYAILAVNDCSKIGDSVSFLVGVWNSNSGDLPTVNWKTKDSEGDCLVYMHSVKNM